VTNALYKWRFWIAATAVFLAAVALRWIRLDIMTFRYDQAAVAFRSMEVFRSGLPFTGIVNSMGFHNAPTYVWMMLPGFLFSPDPRFATALHGFITATMVFPLVMLGHRYRRDALAWLPAIIAAVTPGAVFGGRNLWAQHLLPPLISWALLWLHGALDESQNTNSRIRQAGAALAMLALATTVHYSAAPLLAIVVAILFWRLRRSFPILLKASVPGVLILLTVVPSAIDWYDTRTNPRPKEDFVLKYESVVPPPLPWWLRTQMSAAGVVSVSSVDAVHGIESVTPFAMPLRIYDWTLMFALWGGLAALLHYSISHKSRAYQTLFPKVLLLMLILPVVLGSMLIERVNMGYFIGSMPLVWLLVVFLPERGKILWQFVIIIALIGGVAANVHFLQLISNVSFLNGSYYIPFKDQVKTAAYIAENRVKPGNLHHVEGGWFQHSYDYLHRYVTPPQKPVTSAYAVMDDLRLTDNPPRVDFFLSTNPTRFDEVVVTIFPSRGPAEIFIRKFFEMGS